MKLVFDENFFLMKVVLMNWYFTGPKWQDGAFIGIRDRSDEMLIMTTSGVCKTRNVRPEFRMLGFRIPHDG